MATEMDGLRNIMASVWNEDVRMSLMGYKRVEGLSFWVREDRYGFYTRHEYNRPFTKPQDRAHVREQRKLRWVRRYREIRHRLSHAWDALRGKECDY